MSPWDPANSEIWTKAKLEELDRREVCLHEAGHALLAEHFACLGWAAIERIGDPSRTMRAWVGQCKVDGYRSTPFRMAVVGFGGVAAEIAASEELDFETLVAEVFNAIDTEEDFSETDMALIRRTTKVWRAAKVASRVILRKWGHLLEIAEALSVHGFYSTPLKGFRAGGIPARPNVAAVFPRTPEAPGNAALIAAAPALLEAVEAALPVLAYASEQGGGPMDARAQHARRLAKLALAGLQGGAR